MENGAPFDFKARPYLIGPYQDEHPKQVHKKATQLGISSWAILKSIHSCRYRFPLGVIYFFPTDTDVSDFSRGRVTPLIEHNKETIGQFITDTDTVGMKRVGDAFMYFRGMKSKVGMKSVPADMVVFDEVDEATPDAVSMALKRLSGSNFKEELYLSNPTIPGYGIDLEFQSSDQRHFMLKCPHCRTWNCLEDTINEEKGYVSIGCLVEKKGVVILACKKCGKELDKTKGEWVAKFPSHSDVHGYQYSQLISPTITPLEVYTEWKKALVRGRITNFMNLTLGQAYVTARERLTKEKLLGQCSTMFPANPWVVDGGPVFMGVDQGNGIHVVFARMCKSKLLIWFREHKEFEELDQYMDKVSRCVIDALPETRKAREFAGRHGGQVYLNYYNENQKGGAKWLEDRTKDDWRVEENRTESLDTSHAVLSSTDIVLPPQDEEAEVFAQHCCNTAKKLDEDIETGSKRYIWVKLGPDHYRHAMNYAVISASHSISASDIQAAVNNFKRAPRSVASQQDW
jgi:hypothetical protein